MKSTIVIHSGAGSISNDFPLLYFTGSYLQSQTHTSLFSYENETLFIPIVINGTLAISIPRSPFGSFLAKSQQTEDEFTSFLSELVADLKNKGVRSLRLTHPSSIYSHFVNESWLVQAGFQKLYSDINQHIVLDATWQSRIHKMQKRKQEALQQNGFEFRKIPEDQIEVVHKFIAACRQVQGLTINISLEVLSDLLKTTGAYSFFGVFREERLSAVCVTASVNEETAYYYLPATSPTFRSHSPMVMLIAGMVEYFRSQGFSHFDLGISSIEGKPQESLQIFKERMGAVETLKTTWELGL